MKVFVVHNPELGWDCVMGVYKADNKQEVINHLINEEDWSEKDIKNELVITQKTLEKIKNE